MVRKRDTDLIRGHCELMWHLSVSGPRADAAILESSVLLLHTRGLPVRLFIAGYGLYSNGFELVAFAATAAGFGFFLLESTVFQTVYVKEVISLRDKPKPGA